MTRRIAFAVLAALSLVAAPAYAQTLEEEMAAAESEDGGSSSTSGGATDGTTSSSTGPSGTSGAAVTSVDAGHDLTDEQAELEEVAPAETVDDGISPRELADTDYFFAGLFMRGLIVPDFIQGLFVAYNGGTAFNAGGGGYFQWRRNGFYVMAEVWYAGFGHNGFYHGADAVDSEYEYVEVNLGVVFGSFLFGWNFPVTEWFSLDFGFGFGVGGMTGNLYRTEAYREAPSGTLRACTAPRPGDAYCEGPVEMPGPTGRLDGTRQMGGTYQHMTSANPFYFGDGGIPPMFGWLDLPRLGMTFRPIRQLQIRIDGGYNLFGFNFGGSLGYGF